MIMSNKEIYSVCTVTVTSIYGACWFHSLAIQRATYPEDRVKVRAIPREQVPQQTTKRREKGNGNDEGSASTSTV